jgi:excisionase family DNA binding protein
MLRNALVLDLQCGRKYAADYHMFTRVTLVLKASDIQQLLDLSRGKTYELLHQKGFPVMRIGRCLRVPRDAFLRWLEAGND